MKRVREHRYFALGVMIVLVFAACVLLKKFLDTFELVGWLNTIIEVLMPFMIGFALAYLLNPVMKFFEKKVFERLFQKKEFKHKKKVIRALSVLVTFLICLAGLTAMLVSLLPQLLVSIMGVFRNSTSYVNDISNYIQNLLDGNPQVSAFIDGQFDSIMQSVQQLSNEILPTIQTLLSGVTSGVLSAIETVKNIILGLIISVYVLYAKEKFIAQSKKVIVALLPKNIAKGFIGLVGDTHKMFGGYISGKIIDAILVGILCGIGVYFIYRPYAILIGVLVGVFNIIPFLGPFIGAIPSALLILLEDPMRCLWFIIFIIVLQQFDGNVMEPKILGETTGLSAFWVIFSILVFGALFGFVGMFVGVPLFAAIYTWVRRWINGRLKKKGLSTNTEDYLHMTEKKTQVETAPEPSDT